MKIVPAGCSIAEVLSKPSMLYSYPIEHQHEGRLLDSLPGIAVDSPSVSARPIAWLSQLPCYRPSLARGRGFAVVYENLMNRGGGSHDTPVGLW
jgi:hypothetical protein